METKMNDIDITKIKLIIWDLDETFWEGTLSEGGVKKTDNVKLVKRLSSEGIINTICSKNDYSAADSQRPTNKKINQGYGPKTNKCLIHR